MKKIAKPFLDDLFGSGNLAVLQLAAWDLDGMYTSRQLLQHSCSFVLKIA